MDRSEHKLFNEDEEEHNLDRVLRHEEAETPTRNPAADINNDPTAVSKPKEPVDQDDESLEEELVDKSGINITNCSYESVNPIPYIYYPIKGDITPSSIQIIERVCKVHPDNYNKLSKIHTCICFEELHDFINILVIESADMHNEEIKEDLIKFINYIDSCFTLVVNKMLFLFTKNDVQIDSFYQDYTSLQHYFSKAINKEEYKLFNNSEKALFNTVKLDKVNIKNNDTDEDKNEIIYLYYIVASIYFEDTLRFKGDDGFVNKFIRETCKLSDIMFDKNKYEYIENAVNDIEGYVNTMFSCKSFKTILNTSDGYSYELTKDRNVINIISLTV